ncbi:hypothetical protein CW731_09985 [Polaribacter sp. ALD11]|uniref:hypothetical protein n=1 Tax=Polaribacter sp. ALD11 TaxID=2058137 RepID=UPI000C310F1A|nr:hypothetical protein [Polaribacter sp. ALD11]AUC85596.1 hypothetical protein CW731_09985 [Polaribacter sp. ALD11]
MKNEIKTLGLVVLLFIGSQNTSSQEVASNSIRDYEIARLNTFNVSEEEEKEETIKNTVLSEGKYTFDNGKKEILVEIKDGYYTEYYTNNEFVKAKIKWTSESEYKLVITEINKQSLPFGVGTILNTKISRVKGNRYYYDSNLEGLTWSGKFIKIEDDFLKK